MMDLAMNFDTDECLVTAMFDKGNRNDTMEAIDHIPHFYTLHSRLRYCFTAYTTLPYPIHCCIA